MGKQLTLHVLIFTVLFGMLHNVLSDFGHICLFATPWTVVRQAPLATVFSRQEILEWVAISSSGGSS